MNTQQRICELEKAVVELGRQVRDLAIVVAEVAELATRSNTEPHQQQWSVTPRPALLPGKEMKKG